MAPVASDIAVEWDLDNDGDFDQAVEDITAYVLEGETFSGRNWPSMLQGRSTPGTMRLTLDNSDDRFSFFNTSSPINSGAFSLKTGRRIRAYTNFGTPTEPVRLAYDRFDGTGAIGSTENSLTWTVNTGGFTRTSGTLSTTAAVSVATVDPSPSLTDAFVQTRPTTIDIASGAGVVYRLTDSSNYGRVYVDTTSSTIIHESVIASSPATISTTAIDVRPPGMFIGVNVQGTTAEIYLNGVIVATDTAYAGSGDKWGLFAGWTTADTQRAPEFDEFYLFDDTWNTFAGALWGGTVISIIPSVDNTGRKIAILKAEGPLARMAALEVTPPASFGAVSGSPGSDCGQMVGNIMGLCGLLHPPERIDAGSFVVSAVGLPDQKALNAARRFEEAEQGFLHEMPEGVIRFANKAARAAGAVQATWSDDPAETLNYESIKLLDWRREIINRVESSVGVTAPTIATLTSTSGDSGAGVQRTVDITMPTSGAGGAAGDLVIAFIATPVHTVGESWLAPSGWANLRPELGADAPGQMRIYAKVMSADDLGKVVRFYNDTGTAGGSYVCHHYHIQNWRGDISDGVAVAVNGLGEFPTQAASRLGTHDPPLLYVPWGREPGVFIVVRSGADAENAPTVTAASDKIAPDGYGDMRSNYVNAAGGDQYDSAVQSATRYGSAGVEDPGQFGGTFDEWNHLDCATVAIRGLAPVQRTENDLDSQEDHNAINTHTNAGNVFPSASEADDYNDEIIARYADDAPIVRIGFTATKDNDHRSQADGRRLNDKITLEADNNAGLGINGDFIIESIRHRWNRGDTWWLCEWELSQV